MYGLGEEVETVVRKIIRTVIEVDTYLEWILNQTDPEHQDLALFEIAPPGGNDLRLVRKSFFRTIF
jgi:hypothetical protein